MAEAISGDLNVYRKVILTWILNKYDDKLWLELNHLRLGSGRKRFSLRRRIFTFYLLVSEATVSFSWNSLCLVSYRYNSTWNLNLRMFMQMRID